MTPAFTSAVSRLRERAVVQVRFGNFCEVGISALVRAAFRVGLLVDLIELARDGCTLRFTRSQEPERTEDCEVSQALESLSQSRARAADRYRAFADANGNHEAIVLGDPSGQYFAMPGDRDMTKRLERLGDQLEKLNHRLEELEKHLSDKK